ncbi:class III extradiol ring-cleavage dioxygenase [Hoeflea sp. YIM 152468]|uniref:DODA-type extradiol aromatic ring-opening family dioxygenase n=1 Tax=Hoeflea sp. YIM 152468 TaxID=3031759 RepID=UPI0023DB430E|nr:class III extradiol ring-cleavage dioxygenase [Hoeflea sp. YIM 152468]MDF1607412.1 class III extradiol ring-cleavage dioxygenase [Hoeflea sp. YIM 152468]
MTARLDFSAAPLPALFISHGSPDTAIADTAAAGWLKRLAAELPRPRAIVVVSAHFEVTGHVAVSADPKPETIHDFGGFAPELYAIQYPAPGEPELARQIAGRLQTAGFAARAVDSRGFDHGVWVPLTLIYPDAQIPVVSVSVDPQQGPAHHYRLGQALAGLGRDGVLVIGSGSFTHNLGEAFKALRTGKRTAPVPGWVQAFTTWMGERLAANDIAGLLAYRATAPFAVENHPTDEHLLPLYVAMGAAGETGTAQLLHDSAEFGVLSMSMWRFDPAPVTQAA